jgi:hypothetical protein
MMPIFARNLLIVGGVSVARCARRGRKAQAQSFGSEPRFARHYREIAADCADWANEACTSESRQAYLRMAREHIELARQVKASAAQVVRDKMVANALGITKRSPIEPGANWRQPNRVD